MLYTAAVARAFDFDFEPPDRLLLKRSMVSAYGLQVGWVVGLVAVLRAGWVNYPEYRRWESAVVVAVLVIAVAWLIHGLRHRVFGAAREWNFDGQSKTLTIDRKIVVPFTNIASMLVDSRWVRPSRRAGYEEYFLVLDLKEEGLWEVHRAAHVDTVVTLADMIREITGVVPRRQRRELA